MTECRFRIFGTMHRKRKFRSLNIMLSYGFRINSLPISRFSAIMRQNCLRKFVKINGLHKAEKH